MYQAWQLLVVRLEMLTKPIHLQDLRDMYQLMLPLLQQVVPNKLLSEKGICFMHNLMQLRH